MFSWVDHSSTGTSVFDASGPELATEVNGHRFLNHSSLGYYSQVVRERAKPRVRTRLVKVMVTLAAAIRLPGTRGPDRGAGGLGATPALGTATEQG